MTELACDNEQNGDDNLWQFPQPILDYNDAREETNPTGFIFSGETFDNRNNNDGTSDMAKGLDHYIPDQKDEIGSLQFESESHENIHSNRAFQYLEDYKCPICLDTFINVFNEMN